LPPLQP